MLVQNIVAAVNTKLAGETLTLNQMRLFLDECVDDMNRELNSNFPGFENLNEGDDYNYIPDKYIRSVLIVGAAYKFYETDEEGIVTATQYMYDYKDNLFYMKRDYSLLVPEEYQADMPGHLVGPDINSLIDVQSFSWW